MTPYDAESNEGVCPTSLNYEGEHLTMEGNQTVYINMKHCITHAGRKQM